MRAFAKQQLALAAGPDANGEEREKEDESPPIASEEEPLPSVHSHEDRISGITQKRTQCMTSAFVKGPMRATDKMSTVRSQASRKTDQLSRLSEISGFQSEANEWEAIKKSEMLHDFAQRQKHLETVRQQKETLRGHLLAQRLAHKQKEADEKMEMRAFALQLEQRDKALLEKYELHQKAEKQKVLKLNSERMEISEAIHRQEKDRKLKLMLEREEYKQRTLREWEQQRLAEEERKRTTFTKLREIQEEEIVAKLEREEARKQAQLADKESASAYA